jgi:hypothetical protein
MSTSFDPWRIVQDRWSPRALTATPVATPIRAHQDAVGFARIVLVGVELS